MQPQTADLLDANEEAVRAGTIRIVAPMLQHFGGPTRFAGSIATIKVFEDNSFVRKLLETTGAGRVLVIDGGGSQRCALVGDQLARLGVQNHWVGIVVNGCIRDSNAIRQMDIGVLALGTHPLKTIKRNVGESDVVITFGGVTFTPGDWICADEDGIIVSPYSLA